MRTPFFSIIIPVYNREKTVSRAIESCLNDQDFKDFEIILIDDKSTDLSVDVITGFKDDRIVLVKHDENQGVCPARNTGIEVSSGEWLIFVDSDNALLPGALSQIYKDAIETDKNVYQIAYNCLWGEDDVSPIPQLKDSIRDYYDYIKWASEATERSDVLNCIRRKAFKKLRFPVDKRLESEFHFDFAYLFKTRTRQFPAYHIFQDANNKITYADNRARRDRAPFQAVSMDNIIYKHGKAILKYGPSKYWNLVGAAATNYFLAGYRMKGARFAIHYLNRFPLNKRMWMILFSGFIGSCFLQFVLDMKARCQACKGNCCKT